MSSNVGFSVLALVVLLSVVGLPLLAQQRPYTIHVEDHYFVINPAATGGGADMISGLAVEQPAQQESGGIQTGRLYLQRPVQENKLSLGTYLFHDRTSNWRQTQLMATVAYQIPVKWPSRKGTLSLGLALGTTNFASKWPTFIVNSTTDPILPDTDINRWEFNSGAGLMYRSSRKYLEGGCFFGLSVQPLARRVLDLTVSSTWREAYYANSTVGINIPMANDFILQTSGWIDWALPGQLRPGLRLGVEKFHHYWGGASFSSSGTATAEVGYAFIWNKHYDDPLRFTLTYFKQTGILAQGVEYGLACEVSFRFGIYE